MSGSFNEIDVPPTLISFAVDTGSYHHVISPELKKAGNKLVYLPIHRNDIDLPDYEQIKKQYAAVHEDIKAGRIVSAYAIERHGLAEALAKMAFGNHMGVKVDAAEDRVFFGAGWGSLVAEVPADAVDDLTAEAVVIGEVTTDGVLSYKDAKITMDEALNAWMPKPGWRIPRSEERGADILREASVRQGTDLRSALIRSVSRRYLSRPSPARTVKWTARRPWKQLEPAQL